MRYDMYKYLARRRSYKIYHSGNDRNGKNETLHYRNEFFIIGGII